MTNDKGLIKGWWICTAQPRQDGGSQKSWLNYGKVSLNYIKNDSVV